MTVIFKKNWGGLLELICLVSGGFCHNLLFRSSTTPWSNIILLISCSIQYFLFGSNFVLAVINFCFVAANKIRFVYCWVYIAFRLVRLYSCAQCRIWHHRSMQAYIILHVKRSRRRWHQWRPWVCQSGKSWHGASCSARCYRPSCFGFLSWLAWSRIPASQWKLGCKFSLWVKCRIYYRHCIILWLVRNILSAWAFLTALLSSVLYSLVPFIFISWKISQHFF